MKREMINILTWLANRVAECVTYDWSDGFKLQELNECREAIKTEFAKYVNFNELTEEEAKELRFQKWASEEDIEDDIKHILSEVKDNKLDRDSANEKITNLHKTKSLFLIPLYLVPALPIGIKLICIDGKEIIYDGNNIDLDTRMGCIAYGIHIN